MREGLVAVFEHEDALVAAIERLRRRGHRRLDALTRFASERVIDALLLRRSPLPWVALFGALAGGGGAYGALYWMRVVDQPWNVGGRPLHAAPAFVPITFETTVLVSALAVFLVFVWLCRLPAVSHPVLAAPGIERASDDRFVLVIGEEPGFDREHTTLALADCGALAVHPFGGER